MGKVLMVGSSRSYYLPHVSFGEYTDDVSLLRKDPSSIALVVFIGGADIDPKFYSREKYELTFTSATCDKRDQYAYLLAQEAGIPCTGICRGGQFLIAMAGGFLIQHVEGHQQTHSMTIPDGTSFKVSSLHHQMFGWPLPEGSTLLGWASEKYAKKSFETAKMYSSKFRFKHSLAYSDIDSAYEPGCEEPKFEPEMVYLPNINALATQYHPEMMSEGSAGYKYYVEHVEKLINNRVNTVAANG